MLHNSHATAHMEGNDTAASSAAERPSRRRLPPLVAAASEAPAAWALIAIILRGATTARCCLMAQPSAWLSVAVRANMFAQASAGGLPCFRM